MSARSDRIVLGLFVAVSLGTLGAMVIAFGGAPKFLESRDRYTIVFADAPGVVPGTPVRRSGVRIGEVESVDLDDEHGTVRVQIRVNSKYRLRTGEVPYITQDLLSRDTTIDFVPRPKDKERTKPREQSRSGPIVPVQFAQARPKPAEPPPVGQLIPPGSVIQGQAPPDARTLLREASDVLPSAQQSLNEIRKAVAQFTELAPLIQELLEEYTEVGRGVREAIPELRKTNDEIRDLAKTARTAAPSVIRTVEEVETLVRALQQTGNRLNVLVGENGPKIAPILDRVAGVVENLDDLTGERNRQSVGELLENAKSFSGDLRGIGQTAHELARDVRGVIPEVKAVIQRVPDFLGRVDALLLNVNQVVRPLADRSERITRNIDMAASELATGLHEVRGVLSLFGRGDGSVQKLLTDPSLFNNLNDSTAMLVRLLPRIDRILADVEVFADKIARNPESLGVGGAVRPSAGIKDPPNAVYPPRHGH